MAALLEVENLAVSFYPAAGEVQAVRGVSFSLRQGEVLAVVGESGCGKSVLCKSIMGLLPDVARHRVREHLRARGGACGKVRVRAAEAARAVVFHGVSGSHDLA